MRTRTVFLLVAGVTLVVAGSPLAGADHPTATPVVYIATGENFPDALGAGSAGGVNAGPVLLVQQNAIPAATLDELNRLEPGLIVIVGGTAVVSLGVESQLEALSFNPQVSRIGGANRYETAAMLSEATFPTHGAVSCASTGFLPAFSHEEWAGEYPRESTNAVTGTFVCAVSIPHGATVTGLTAGITDQHAGISVACVLERFGITQNSRSVVAQTSLTVGSSGFQTVSGPSTANAKVDNINYAYSVRCTVGIDLHVHGVSVEYSMP